MKHQSRLVLAALALFFCPLIAYAGDPLCRLTTDAHDGGPQLATFVIVGTAHHGYSVISPKCPGTPTPSVSLLSLGRGSRAKAFRRNVSYGPSSGFWKIQADVQLVGHVLELKRVHSYRELSKLETSTLETATFSRSEAASIEEAAEKAATDARKARR